MSRTTRLCARVIAISFRERLLSRKACSELGCDGATEGVVPRLRSGQFPAAANLPANFFLSRSEFGKSCPKSENFAVQAGNGSGIRGNLPANPFGQQALGPLVRITTPAAAGNWQGISALTVECVSAASRETAADHPPGRESWQSELDGIRSPAEVLANPLGMEKRAQRLEIDFLRRLAIAIGFFGTSVTVPQAAEG